MDSMKRCFFSHSCSWFLSFCS